jgi:hypothetical protein
MAPSNTSAKSKGQQRKNYVECTCGCGKTVARRTERKHRILKNARSPLVSELSKEYRQRLESDIEASPSHQTPLRRRTATSTHATPFSPFSPFSGTPRLRYPFSPLPSRKTPARVHFNIPTPLARQSLYTQTGSSTTRTPLSRQAAAPHDNSTIGPSNSMSVDVVRLDADQHSLDIDYMPHNAQDYEFTAHDLTKSIRWAPEIHVVDSDEESRDGQVESGGHDDTHDNSNVESDMHSVDSMSTSDSMADDVELLEDSFVEREMANLGKFIHHFSKTLL